MSLIAFAIYTMSQPTTTYTETTEKEPETGGGVAVAINNINDLSEVLLPAQTQVFRNSINTFLLSYLDPNITSSKIISKPVINQDGSVSITMEASAPSGKSYSFERTDPNSEYALAETITGTSKATYRFTVLINRDNYRSLTITINEYNYKDVQPISN